MSWKSSFVTALVLCSVASGCATGLRVQSEPSGADVTVTVPGQAPRKLGQTPLSIASVSESLRSEPAQITIEKDGYKSNSVLVPASLFERSAQIDVKLSESKLPQACQNQETSLQEVATGVAESQSLIQTKNFDRAEIALTRLTEKYSTVSVLYDLLGNVYYLRRDLDRALATYRKSIELYPANAETSRMIKKIEEIKGVKQ